MRCAKETPKKYSHAVANNSITWLLNRPFSFNLLNVLLKDVCNISDNKSALQIRKKIFIFFSMFYFRAFIFLGLHAVPLTN